jgi:amino acid transporter
MIIILIIIIIIIIIILIIINKHKTHTWPRGPRRRGFSQRLETPPDSQPQLNILERPDER